MNRLIAISVIVGLTGLVMKPMGPYLEYALNREFIANNYCGNQEKPQLKCNGSCYLMQRLKTQADDSRHDQNVSLEEIGQDIEVTFPRISNALWYDFHLRDALRVESSLPENWIAPPVAPPPQLT